jgi:Spy/CpxP family protein refolding chaperone
MAPAGVPSWRNPRVLRILVVVFLCGVSAGMLVMGLGLRRSTYASQPSWRESGKEITLQRFKKELNLTPAQAQQLETVLDDFFMYYHTLQAQLDDVRATGKKRILRLLDEEQKRKFEKLTAELQAKLR